MTNIAAYSNLSAMKLIRLALTDFVKRFIRAQEDMGTLEKFQRFQQKRAAGRADDTPGSQPEDTDEQIRPAASR